MCNINILLSKETFKDRHAIIETFMQSVTSASYVYNNFADGVYFNGSNTLHRDFNKLNFLDYTKFIKSSNIIITHQRLATHGFNKESNQPFYTEGFVFVHNGVLSEWGNIDKNKSDSLNMFDHFIQLFRAKMTNKAEKDREQIILTCIKECIEDKTGSFSIVLFDKLTQIIYYFKNSMTDINFFRAKNDLFITTKEDNKNFLSFLGEKFNKIKIKSNSIYKIYIDSDIRVLKIGKIKHLTYFTNNIGNYSAYGEIKSDNNPIFLKSKVSHASYNDLDYDKNDYLQDLKEEHACYYCNNATYKYDNLIKQSCCSLCFDRNNGLNKSKDYIG